MGLFACRTTQNLDMVRRQYPGAHLLCSDRGTYGTDDRIAIMALFDGIARRAGYRDMRRAIESGDVWETDNYWLPHDRRQADHLASSATAGWPARGAAPISCSTSTSPAGAASA